MERLSFYNEWHLGDCIFNINYINRLVRQNDHVSVDYYLMENYISQVQEFNLYKNRIRLHPLAYRSPNAVKRG
jgi:hypothetical protein